MSFDSLPILTLSGLEKFTWERLRHLEIRSVMLKMVTVLDFLRVHAGSLQHLELCDVTFNYGERVDFMDRLRLWHDDSSMQLDECCICTTRNHAVDVKYGIGIKVATSETQKAFLRGQGGNPFRDARFRLLNKRYDLDEE